MGTSGDYPPFELSQKGELVGFDIDVANAICEHLGYTLEAQDMPFNALIGALGAGRVDFIMAGLSKTPERAKHVTFSDPYYTVTLAVLYKDSPELENQRVGVQLGSTMETFLNTLIEEGAPIDLIARDRNDILVQELKNGRLDCVLLESSQARSFAQANPSLKAADLGQADFQYAVAFPKNVDPDFLAQFNQALATLHEDGTLAALQSKWL